MYGRKGHTLERRYEKSAYNFDNDLYIFCLCMCVCVRVCVCEYECVNLIVAFVELGRRSMKQVSNCLHSSHALNKKSVFASIEYGECE